MKNTNNPPIQRRNKTSDPNVLALQVADIATVNINSYQRLAPEVDDTARIQRAIDYVNGLGGGVVLVPKATYTMNATTQVIINSNVSLIGSGKSTSIFRSAGSKTHRMFELSGSNIFISNITFDGNELNVTDYLTSYPILEINYSCENITITNCSFLNAFSGVWINPNPTLNCLIKNVVIRNNLFDHLEHSIYIGVTGFNTVNRNDNISNILIEGNIIRYGLHQSDGIKTTERCNDIIISNNIIHNMERDSIDLFASGDNVTISNNILKNNGATGIDIKLNTGDWPNDTYGYVRKINIIGNKIDYNTLSGVSISQEQNSTIDTYLITVSNNSFTGNAQNGVMANGNYLNITDNMFYKNGTDTSDTFAGIRVQPRWNRELHNINMHGNTIINNGNVTTGGYGIYLVTSTSPNNIRNCNITNNNIINDSTLGTDTIQQGGLFIGSLCFNINVKNNKIKGHQRDVWIKNGADVTGESIRINLGDLTAAAYNKYYTYVAKNTVSLIDATIINKNNINVDATNYITFFIGKVVTGSFSSIISLSTATAAITGWTPSILNSFPSNSSANLTTDNNRVENGTLFGLLLGGYGTSQPLTGCAVEIRYIEY